MMDRGNTMLALSDVSSRIKMFLSESNSLHQLLEISNNFSFGLISQLCNALRGQIVND